MNQGIAYNVDIAICIDVTGSMSPIIEEVKARARRLHSDIQADLEAKGKEIACLRVRIIAFKDIRTDSDGMTASPFFVLPNEEASFADFVDRLGANGGGDIPESGLHALAIAFQSDWTLEGDKQRHVIVVWTDASSHDLGEGSLPSDLQSGVPSTFDELTDQWEAGQGSLKLKSGARRLIIFAPDDPSWNQISDAWEQLVHIPSRAGEGLSDIDYDVIIDAIGNSV